MVWMVIRVRGTIHARHDIELTLKALHLTRPNHATIVPEEPSVRGMLSKVQGYVTWGELEPETANILVAQRGLALDGQPLSAGSELSKLTHSVLSAGLPRTQGLRPLMRLRAPKGGWRSTKKPFALGGALGYRGRSINDLARRMV